MWIFAIPLMIAMSLAAIVAGYEAGGDKEIRASVDTEVALYRAFVFTADMYFRAAPAPGAKTVYYWADIRTAAPPGVRASNMPASWKAVRGVDGKWAACTELSEGSLAAVGALYPPVEGGASSRVVDLGSVKGVALGAEAEALAAGDLCKGA